MLGVCQSICQRITTAESYQRLQTISELLYPSWLSFLQFPFFVLFSNHKSNHLNRIFSFSFQEYLLFGNLFSRPFLIISCFYAIASWRSLICNGISGICLCLQSQIILDSCMFWFPFVFIFLISFSYLMLTKN